MRRYWIIVGWCFAATAAVAQQPKAGNNSAISLNPAGQQPTNAVAPPTSSQLDGLLLQWEQKMRSVAGLEATVTRTETDSVTKTNETYQGKVRFLRPDKASLYLQKDGKKEVYEQYIYTGTFLYEYRPQTKQLRIHEIAPKPGQAMDDNFLNFLFGLKADEAKRRYEIALAKQDAHFSYLFVNPKTPADRAEFSKARLVLWNATFLPRQLEFETPSGNVVKWDIPQMDANARLTAVDFKAPEVPKDWTVQRVPRANPNAPAAGPAAPGVNPVPPTKVRPNGG